MLSIPSKSSMLDKLRGQQHDQKQSDHALSTLADSLCTLPSILLLLAMLSTLSHSLQEEVAHVVVRTQNTGMSECIHCLGSLMKIKKNRKDCTLSSNLRPQQQKSDLSSQAGVVGS